MHFSNIQKNLLMVGALVKIAVKLYIFNGHVNANVNEKVFLALF